MIISHKYKYLFVELPITGTTAIAKELQKNYYGNTFLRKHSTYDQFLKVASEEEKKYFVFSCIRNPMDRTVSQFIKYKTDQEIPRSRNIRRQIVKLFTLRKYMYIKNKQPDFSQFFLKFYKFPYDDMSSLRHSSFNYLIRFENLQEGFNIALNKIGIEKVGEIPFTNLTKGKKKAFLSYFTPETHNRAKKVFSIMMKNWNYQFPVEWGDYTPTKFDRFQYNVLHVFKKRMWNLLK